MGLKIVLFGAPGAGKGTQAETMAKKYGIVHISTGDIFRKNLREGTELGQQAKKYMDEGNLVPDEVTVGMVEQRLAEPDCADGFILDGFPRTKPQAVALTDILNRLNMKLDAVVNIDVDDEVVVKRLSSRRQCAECGAVFNLLTRPTKREGICDLCGGKVITRKDDNPDTIRNRLKVYRNESAPVLDYYRAQSLVIEIDGSGTIENTAVQVDRELAK